jgi:RimJ/RimL family protein N-acetyltransferase
VDEQGALKSYILIAEDEESTPIGQIRFDARADGDWEVGVSIAKQMRNRGLARDLIENGLIAILKEDLNARVHAFVKPSNIASMKAFERAAFRRIDAQEIRGHQAVHLIYERS